MLVGTQRTVDPTSKIAVWMEVSVCVVLCFVVLRCVALRCVLLC